MPEKVLSGIGIVAIVLVALILAAFYGVGLIVVLYFFLTGQGMVS